MNDPSFNTVSQSAHFWFGCTVAYTFNLWTNPWWGVLAVLSFAAVKEFIYDQNYESPTVRGSNWEDFGFYALGAVVTAGVLSIVK